MADSPGNRLLGQFTLDGIPPAPRGVPQIEVTFDIDANGILKVRAKDLGTGREKEIEIKQSGGLSKEEIERLRREAELHAEEDRRKRQLAEARNEADAMCYQLEKLLREHDAKLHAADKEAVRKAIEKTRQVAKGDNTEAIRSAIRELEQASHALSRTLYESAARGRTAGASAGRAEGGKDEAIDAEFEVKD